MSIKERVIANAANWISLAQNGKITWREASLLINAFELGIAELGEHIGDHNHELQAYEQTADVNLYIISQGKEIEETPTGSDLIVIENLKRTLRATVDFQSRNKINSFVVIDGR